LISPSSIHHPSSIHQGRPEQPFIEAKTSYVQVGL
jgi:hypothetical protein